MYIKPDFSEKNSPIRLDEINQVELNIGYKLPESYKNFLLEQNGGMLKNQKYEYDENELNINIILCHEVIFEDLEIIYPTIINFFSLDVEQPNFISRSDDKGSSYPSEVYGNYGVHLVIGDDTDGNQTSISLNYYDYGSIYIFNGHGDYKETYKNCAKISDSFEEFMNTFVFCDPRKRV